MSRIGNQPIAIPADVTATIEDKSVTIKGPKGTLVREFDDAMIITKEENEIIVKRINNLKRNKSIHGLTRTLISNMIEGTTNGFKKHLEINGIGYRAKKQGNKLTLTLGYSHPIVIMDPEGVKSEIEDNKITITGICKEKVGQHAAEIRMKRAPEPYKGKGIKYDAEIIQRKEGKTGK